jgi:hypothetical protein
MTQGTTEGTKVDAYADSYRLLQSKLLDRYGLDAQSRFIHLDRIGARIHVLEAGTGEPVFSCTVAPASAHSRFPSPPGSRSDST